MNYAGELFIQAFGMMLTIVIISQVVAKILTAATADKGEK